MDKDFCIGCETFSKPTCAIYSIISSIDIDSFLFKSNLKKTDVLVCHKNAQEIVNSHLNIKNICDNCGLCRITCSRITDTISISDKLEIILFSNLNLLNVYFSKVFAQCKIASEVKSFGNYRQKRIDIVIKKKQKVYFIKVLSDLNKHRFYMDSYNEQAEEYNKNIKDYDFTAFALVSKDKTLLAEQMQLNIITITDLKEILGD